MELYVVFLWKFEKMTLMSWRCMEKRNSQELSWHLTPLKWVDVFIMDIFHLSQWQLCGSQVYMCSLKDKTNIGFILLGVWQFAKYWTLHLHWYGRTCISLGKSWHCYLSFLILFVLTEYRFLIFIKYNNLINFLVLADNKLFASVQYLFCVIAVI